MQARSAWFLLLAAALLGTPCYALDPPIFDPEDRCITCQAVSPTLAQAEPSVAIKPSDPNFILVTSNTWPTSVYTAGFNGTAASISTNGGIDWTVQEQGTGGANLGDPGCGILASGRLLNSYLHPTGGEGTVWSDNLGVTWNPVLAGSGNVDRGHLWVDALSRVHVAWTEQLPSHRIKVALSQDNGGSYAPDVEISDASDTEQDFHVNLHSGPGPGSTYVYATWTTADTDPRRDEKNLGFARSLDGVSWQPAVRITTVGSPSVPLYVRGTSVSGLADGAKNTRTLYSNPSLAVDQTTGHIWLAWCNRGNPLVPPAGSGPPSAGTNDRNIYVIKSTDFGQTWTLPAGLLPSGEARPVNQDPPSTPNTADQWFPRIARDHATGTLAVLFYDSRNHNYGAGDYTADVYLAVSRDGGVTWEDFKISDTLQLMDGSGVYKPTFTNPGNDYVGLAASHGRAYAVWADDRTRGHLRINSSRVLLWGILQSSVAAAYVNLSGNMIRVTATWNTNMAASVADQLILVSPNQQQYVSPLCTTCSPGGLSHTLVFDAPCEPGLWSFTVKSKESFGTERQSATATFFVAPTVIAGGDHRFKLSGRRLVHLSRKRWRLAIRGFR